MDSDVLIPTSHYYHRLISPSMRRYPPNRSLSPPPSISSSSLSFSSPFSSIFSSFLPDNDVNSSDIVLLAVSVTVLLLFVVLATIFLGHRRDHQQLDWQRRNNLLGIVGISPPKYVRCKALPRLDTEDDPREEERQNRRPSIRKQSRIHEIIRHSLDLPSSSSRDPSDLFTVPKLAKTSNASSMFQSLDQSQIDRGLYHISIDQQVVESSYDEKASCGNCGCVNLSLSMDQNMNLLTVSLRQALDIVAKRQEEQPNPYFKVALDIPDSPLPKVEHRSKICKYTASPLISEDFFFQIPSGNVGQCRLEIMVFDYDQFTVDECIGYCSLTLGRLATLSTNRSQPTVLWAEVLPFEEDNGSGFGELLFSLSYLSRAQRFTVNIFKARNLCIETNRSGSSSSTLAESRFSSIAVRATLFIQRSDRRPKRKKTSSKRTARNVQFNESLAFSMPNRSLCDAILEFEIINEYGTFGMASRVLGRLEVPLSKCRELWRAIIREESAQARWHSLEEP